MGGIGTNSYSYGVYQPTSTVKKEAQKDIKTDTVVDLTGKQTAKTDITGDIDGAVAKAKTDGTNKITVAMGDKTLTLDVTTDQAKIDQLKAKINDPKFNVNVNTLRNETFSIFPLPTLASEIPPNFSTTTSTNSFLKTNFGQDITNSLGISNPPKNNIEKGSLAYTMGMVETRQDYLTQNSTYLDSNGLVDKSKPAFKALVNDARSNSATSKASAEKMLSLIMSNPDTPVSSKISSISELTIDPVLAKKLDNTYPGYKILDAKSQADPLKIRAMINMNKRTNIDPLIASKTDNIYKNLGGVGATPKQYLAAVGDGSGSTGIGFRPNVGVGYFNYQKIDKGDASKNNFNVQSPIKEDLDVKLSFYGFNSIDDSKMTIKIGNKVDINMLVAPDAGDTNKPGKMSFDKDPANLTSLSNFLQTKGIPFSVSPVPSDAAIQTALKKAGINIDLANNTVKLNKDEYGGINTKFNFTGAASSDERQIQVSTNGSLSTVDKFEAKDLYDVAKFDAQRDKMTVTQKNLLDDMVSKVNLPPLTSTRPVKMDLNTYFNAVGGSVNPDGKENGQDIMTLTKSQKDNLRSTSATVENNKLKIVSYTDPDKTGVKPGANNDFHDYFNDNVGADLKKAFIDKGVYKKDDPENNNTLSALRTLSFVKLTVMEKYKDAKPPLTDNDFANMTVSVSVKDQSGKDVVITAKLSDIPSN